MALASAFAASQAAAADVSASTVAVQAVSPTPDGRARVVECSGALIAPDLVLTAGHCLDLAAGPAQVAAFAYRDGKVVPKPLLAAAIARHPGHVRGWAASPGDPSTRRKEISADLALIRLASPVEGAVLASFGEPSAGAGALNGVGAASPGGRSGALKRITLSAVRLATGDGPAIAFATADRTVCGGDSGGPVSATGPDGARVWGVAAAVIRSSGGGCGTRIVVTPADPASPAFAAMRAGVGR